MLTVTTCSAVVVTEISVYLKEISVRGRKREDWVEYMHSNLYIKFELLSELGVKLSNQVFKPVTKPILCDYYSLYRIYSIDLSTGKILKVYLWFGTCIYQPFQYRNSDEKWYVNVILRTNMLHLKMLRVSFWPIEAEFYADDFCRITVRNSWVPRLLRCRSWFLG